MVRAMTVRIGGYTALERPDGGHRAGVAALWRGEDGAGDAVGLLLLPVSNTDQVRRTVDAVSGVVHPHLLPVVDVVADDERIAVVSRWPRGGRLLELIRRRGTLDAGQAVTVLIPLASALAAVHRAGVRHAGVGAGSVFFDEHGRPQLTGPAISILSSAVNGGLPADSWDVAPEVVRGERLQQVPISPAADVFSLGSVALYCLTGSSAWPADDPADVLIQSTAGVWPEPPAGAGPPALLQLIRDMLLDDPAARPAAADLVGMLAAVGAPSPVPLGQGQVPAASPPARWGGWAVPLGATAYEPPQAPSEAPSAEQSGPASERSDETTRPTPVPPDSAGTTDVSRPEGAFKPGAITQGANERGTRVRRAPPRSGVRGVSLTAGAGPRRAPVGSAGAPKHLSPLVRAGIAALTVALVIVVTVQVWVWSSGSEDATAAADRRDAAENTAVLTTTAESAASAGRPVSVPDPDWRAVVTALDTARSTALSTGDPALLDQVYVQGVAAAEADTATIRLLAERGWRVGGALHRIDDVTLLAAAQATVPGADQVGADRGPAPPDPATGQATQKVRVVVEGSLPAYPVLDGDGRQVALTAARSTEKRILSLISTGVGYRISAVEPG